MRPLAVPVAILILVTAGCTAHASPAPPVAADPAPAGCSAAMAMLPARAPATEQQATNVMSRLAGHRGGTLASLMDGVAADALKISFDLQMGGNVAGDLKTYDADVSELRSYCQ